MTELEKSRFWAKAWVHTAIVATWCLILVVALFYLIEVLK